MNLTKTSTWKDYAGLALAEKCFPEAHQLTYPLISAQTELNELDEAVQAYVDRVKRLRLTKKTRQLAPEYEATYEHVCDELGDVIWAMTALYSACGGEDWSLIDSFQSFAACEGHSLKVLRKHNGAEPALATYCEAMRHELIPIADAVCKSLRIGSDIDPRKIGKDKQCFFTNIFEQLGMMAVALDCHVHDLLNAQLTKVADRKKAGIFQPVR